MALCFTFSGGFLRLVRGRPLAWPGGAVTAQVAGDCEYTWKKTLLDCTGSGGAPAESFGMLRDRLGLMVKTIGKRRRIPACQGRILDHFADRRRGRISCETKS